MENAELLESNEVIDESASPEQADAFRSVIEALEEEDYVALNDYLNAGVAEGADWQDYLEAFSRYEWSEFSYAFHDVMGRDLSLD